MSSLVVELQRHAMDSTASVPDLLRKALVVATKLWIVELRDWVQRESNGYNESDTVPE